MTNSHRGMIREIDDLDLIPCPECTGVRFDKQKKPCGRCHGTKDVVIHRVKWHSPPRKETHPYGR